MAVLTDELVLDTVTDDLEHQPCAPSFTNPTNNSQHLSAHLPSHGVALGFELDGHGQFHYMHASGGSIRPLQLPASVSHSRLYSFQLRHINCIAMISVMDAIVRACSANLARTSPTVHAFPITRDVPCTVTYLSSSQVVAGASVGGADGTPRFDDINFAILPVGETSFHVYWKVTVC